MGPTTEHWAALAVLGLNAMPRSRKDLARLVARCHPACNPWSGIQTAAYREVWEELEIGSDADAPLAA
ncbi:hypothetical protein FQK07_10085 [Synechococcus sp. BSF8S]|nr:hypothetical protein [Synechococcus sp. BSF8S]MBC1264534.1 hypothetical protein [Synechococcus sp. BSA11S]